MDNNVSFQEDNSLDTEQLAQENRPKMVQWVMKMGLAKTEQQAAKVLVGIAVVAILVGIGAFVMSSSSPPSQGEIIDARTGLSENEL